MIIRQAEASEKASVRRYCFIQGLKDEQDQSGEEEWEVGR